MPLGANQYGGKMVAKLKGASRVKEETSTKNFYLLGKAGVELSHLPLPQDDYKLATIRL